MRKIVIAGLNECLGSAFSGLTDILTLARRAVVRAAAPAESAEDPFYVVTASADGESIRDRAGASFPVAASFEAIYDLRRDHRAEFLAWRGRKAAGHVALWRDRRLATPRPCARGAHRGLWIGCFSSNCRKDGALFHNTLKITPPFDADDGRLPYVLGVQSDVSAQVQAELEIGDLKAKLMSLTD